MKGSEVKGLVRVHRNSDGEDLNPGLPEAMGATSVSLLVEVPVGDHSQCSCCGTGASS